MKDTLADIRKKLQEGTYRNEEHVRLSLVARVLQKLGWDIWNPAEVNAEFAAVPSEDKTKVDLALFSNPYEPSIFIEVKAVGKITDLSEIERQLRNYNRDNAAPFCIITDGRTWRFYFSLTAGEFSNKCFEKVDLLSDASEDVERVFSLFLSKANIDSGKAKEEAEARLKRSRIERIMADCLPKARRQTQEPPFPNLLDALVSLAAEQGVSISRDKAREFIVSVVDVNVREPPVESPVTPTEPITSGMKVTGFSFRGEAKSVGNWRKLLLEVMNVLYHAHPAEFDKLCELGGWKRHWVSKSPKDMGYPERLRGTDYYIETKFGARDIAKFCRRAVAKLGHDPHDVVIHAE